MSLSPLKAHAWLAAVKRVRIAGVHAWALRLTWEQSPPGDLAIDTEHWNSDN